MNKDIILEMSKHLQVSEKQIEVTLHLLEEGNTIPFISRYRKEMTGNLNEEQIREINEVYMYQVNLLKRKEDVIRLIDEKGLMTDELKQKIMQASKLVEVEDLYRPYKEKKKTKATEAIALGLEPLAKKMMSCPTQGDIETLTKPYLNDKVKTMDEAITGAKYIIAEYISDNAYYRKWIRKQTFFHGILVSKHKKNATDELKTYEMYYDYQEPLRSVKSHRVLALNRGEKEKILNVSIQIDAEPILQFLIEKVIRGRQSFTVPYINEAIEDSYKRLIKPSIERELRAEATEKAEEVAINNFGDNLEKLLMQPPMKDKVVLGFDPAYRTGCKLAVIDPTGKPETIAVIYPHEPKNLYKESKEKVLQLIDQYHIDIIAIGNGTASRESEAFVADVIQSCKTRKVEYIIVNEAGASVYSASKLAIQEFPKLHVEERSAISIGRRLQDPLAELVKIDPQSIGVGLYQHDVSNKRLTESLDFVVSKAVNQVGVNINTASASLLKYVSGLTKKNIDKILDYRNTYGKIKDRQELKKKKLLSDKVFTQAIGFLRIPDAENILDHTGIHPESYAVTLQLLKELNEDLKAVGTEHLNRQLQQVDIDNMSQKLGTDKYTLEDIIKSLLKPNRDPRDDMPKPLLKSDILKLEDLKVGMKLQGTVRNVVDFGAFIDIGIKNDGLVHISKMTNQYIRHPKEIVSVGDIVDCYVDEIFPEKKKVSLSLIEPQK